MEVLMFTAQKAEIFSQVVLGVYYFKLTYKLADSR